MYFRNSHKHSVKLDVCYYPLLKGEKMEASRIPSFPKVSGPRAGSTQLHVPVSASFRTPLMMPCERSWWTSSVPISHSPSCTRRKRTVSFKSSQSILLLLPPTLMTALEVISSHSCSRAFLKNVPRYALLTCSEWWPKEVLTYSLAKKKAFFLT